MDLLDMGYIYFLCVNAVFCIGVSFNICLREVQGLSAENFFNFLPHPPPHTIKEMDGWHAYKEWMV